MIDRTMDRLGLYPERLIADSAYGSAPMLGWLVEERGIEPHIPVFDKSGRSDGTLERADFPMTAAPTPTSVRRATRSGSSTGRPMPMRRHAAASTRKA